MEPELGTADSWIGVVPVGTEEPAEGPRGAKEESFTTAVVTKVTLCLTLSPLLALSAAWPEGHHGVCTEVSPGVSPGQIWRILVCAWWPGGSLTASGLFWVPCDPSPWQRVVECFLQQDRSLLGTQPCCPLMVSPLSLQMKRALVLGASALLILALNQNAIHEVGQCRRRGRAGTVPRSRLRFPPGAAGPVPAARQARHRHPVLGQCHQAAGSAAAVRVGLWVGLVTTLSLALSLSKL